MLFLFIGLKDKERIKLVNEKLRDKQLELREFTKKHDLTRRYDREKPYKTNLTEETKTKIKEDNIKVRNEYNKILENIGKQAPHNELTKKEGKSYLHDNVLSLNCSGIMLGKLVLGVKNE